MDSPSSHRGVSALTSKLIDKYNENIEATNTTSTFGPDYRVTDYRDQPPLVLNEDDLATERLYRPIDRNNSSSAFIKEKNYHASDFVKDTSFSPIR